MSQATEAVRPRGATETRLIASISAAHFVSHYYLLLLPPLFGSVRTDYGVSYTELGLALATFSIVSAMLQTPAGFLVDWLGPRLILIAGMLLGATAFAIAGLVDSFWVLVAMFGLAGLGNTAYHPADYAILSHHVPATRVAKAFSIHTFAGMLGSAVAPGSVLLMQSQWGWRGAFVGAAVLGFAVAALLIAQGEEPALRSSAPATSRDAPASWRLLLSRPILVNVAFFALLNFTNGGLQNYSVVALGALHATPLGIANTALTGYLLLTAVGVLAGGYLATRTKHHGTVAALGLVAMAGCAATVVFDFGHAFLIAVMSLAGLSGGMVMPSRDMIVRAITPPGSFGKVFGFVTNGFSVGGIVAPMVFGLVMDHGKPQWIFLLVALFCLVGVLTVAGVRNHSR